VPYGPWKKYGQDPAVLPAGPLAGSLARVPASTADLPTQQRYIENLRKLRDEQFAKKPLSQLQN